MFLPCLFATIFAVVLLSRGTTVYSAKATLTVQAPLQKTTRPLPWMTIDPIADPLAATGALAALVNQGHPLLRSTSSEVTLYGEGYTSAVSARLLDIGSQWVSVVRDPIIEIEVVDPDENVAATKLQGLVHDVAAELAALQNRLDVAPSQRVTTVLTPAEPSFVAATSSRSRAVGGVLVLGVLMSFVAAYWSDVWARRRGGSRDPREAGAPRRVAT